MSVYKVSVCMYTRGMYVCILGICMYVYKGYVCMYTRGLYVCIQGVCMSVYKGYVCLYVCIQGVCMSVCIYTKYLFVNLFPFIVSKLHPYRLHGQENDH